ncbi:MULTISPECIES: respiratory chain complex I subunit 1 family protein [Thermococcus]|uniref:Membrane-bound NADP+-reducing complex MBX, subunit MbxM (Dehydrogenase subunit) n=2 Tax=Thermococcus sibiricus TaxID=172049 RepID=C5ZZX7_THESM|nr:MULTISPECIES: respiratory chain complex I subunit 1 family protein [Thermococcus]KUK29177.1 MAG: Membrane-bound NADP+-reducing complex MBX, subunit MbxM (Dehydrogenase subunit) [Thermococcus sp. 40_45]HII66996.1 respiratory chain complex I subunit 1 family protein [Thermococcaceae archaeon]ACS90958.1 Membrane-bound NADP+-reducing complex MBX, subunit MbxM (dehydrogenase subunit) [Thermococcus sibiricus MM 739]KUK17201.1 MAG: Membrane-bound NADP+-reducing complex MBX, subunit MbxM (Dehydrogen
MIETALKALFILIYATFVGFMFMGIIRIVTARIHRRVGPPIYQPILDTIKLLSKKSNITHGLIYDFGVIYALGATILAIMFIPLGNIGVLRAYGDLVLITFLLEIPMLGIMFAAMSSGNPYAGIGAQRALLTMLAIQVPLGFAIVALAEYYGTFSTYEIVMAQQSMGWSITALPLLFAAIAYDLVLQAMFGKEPFDIMIAPGEISLGPMVEFGGKHMGILQIQHAIALFGETLFFSNIFLGGAVITIFGSSILNTIATLAVLLIKQIAVLLVATFMGAIFPRFTIDQAARFYWKWPTIIAALGAILATL